MTGPRGPDQDPGDAAWATHAAALDRLAAHRRRAEAAGWTSCALEREGGSGALALYGVPPEGTLRTRIAVVSDAEAPPADLAIAARAVRRTAAVLARVGAIEDRRVGRAGGPPGSPGTTTPAHGTSDGETRERLARVGEREAWQAQDVARAALAGAVAAYTRLLRTEGQSARRAVIAVEAAVRAGAAPVAVPEALARLAHEAGCSSVESYYAP